jgi:asparagine synthase (glutamine-hydrolysing)
MLAPLRVRAPHGDSFFSAGHVALGQAFLRTGSSGHENTNALTLDGHTWIVADARIDGRPELVARLRAKGCEAGVETPDGELLLHAYSVFGEELVHHVIGDFAFALWDARRQLLFCARDHFGVRPFFYAEWDGCVAFASHIEALLTLDGLPTTLDRRAVGDMLLFGMCMEAERTIYQSIRCLPAGSLMKIEGGRRTVRRWWTLKRGPEQRRADAQEYVDEFLHAFRRAVLDRVPAGPFALQLSGGVDSTSIAAVAASGQPTAKSCFAYHFSARHTIAEDDEHVYAQQVADHLGLRMDCWDIDAVPLFARAPSPAHRTAYPVPTPHLAVHAKAQDAICAAGSHVVLSGFMGDAVLSPQQRYFSDLVRHGRILKFIRETARHMAISRSPKGLGLRTVWRRRAPLPDWVPAMPDWLDPALVQEFGLRGVWDDYWASYAGTVDNIEHMRLPWHVFEFQATQALPHQLVIRYPFLDLRLIEFASGLPNALLVNKAVMRLAMKNMLPRDILERPKTGMPGDIVREMVSKCMLDSDGGAGEPSYVVQSAFEAAWNRYREGAGSESTSSSWLMMQAHGLAHWLYGNKMDVKDGRNG